jgi:hypothetical protein
VPVIVEGLQLVRPGIVVKTEQASLAREVSEPAIPDAAATKKETESPKSKNADEGLPMPGGPRSAVKAAEDELPKDLIVPAPTKPE